MVVVLTPVILMAGLAQRPFVVGFLSATVLWALVFITLVLDGSFNLRIGTLAESWTADSLDRFRKQGWNRVDTVDLGDHDIDHVLIGVSGVYAIETKYVGDGQLSWRLPRAARQAREGARTMTLFLLHHADVTTKVLPLVVFWGPGADELKAPRVVDGVRVMGGRHIEDSSWAPADRVVLSGAEVLAAMGALGVQRQDRERYEAKRRLAPARKASVT